MRKHIVALIFLILLQMGFTVAIGFLIQHLTNMWYFPKDTLAATIQAEFNMGGWALTAEIAVVVLAILGTIAFEIWLIISGYKDKDELMNKVETTKNEIIEILQKRNVE